jgi:hypothetical protein
MLDGDMTRGVVMRLGTGLRRAAVSLLAGASACLLGPRLADAADEIQVYNAEIAEVGQFSVQQHLNYAITGRNYPDFPGGLVPNHALNGTPEFAYGVTPWFELGLYIPWAVNEEGQFLSNAFKLRTLFVTPDAAKKDFFYGLNFEYDYTTAPFSPTRFAMEVRPIIGWRNPQWEFIVNPIVDFTFGANGNADFAPNARLARKLGEDFFIGLEYYTDLGTPGSFSSFQDQVHELFAVADFKVGEIDVDIGLGYGLTTGSDKWIVKTILSYAFPVPGKSGDSDAGSKTPPTMRARQPSASQMALDPLAGLR